MFNNSPQIELTDVTTCLEIVQLREKYFDSLVALQAQLALRNDRLKQFAPSMLPNVHVIGAELFTQCRGYWKLQSIRKLTAPCTHSVIRLRAIRRPLLARPDRSGASGARYSIHPCRRLPNISSTRSTRLLCFQDRQIHFESSICI